MLFFNHSTAESERWVHLFSYNRESNVSRGYENIFFYFCKLEAPHSPNHLSHFERF